MRPHVQVLVGSGDPIPSGLGTALARLDASVSFGTLDTAARRGASRIADAFVIVATAARSAADVDAVVARLSDRPRRTLVVSEAHPGDGTRHAAASATPAAEIEEVTARLRGILAAHARRAIPARTAAPLTAEAQIRVRASAHLREAARLRRALQSSALPAIGPLQFDLLTRCADDVAGDLCDVRRLDERRVLITLSDAEGHGLPAALLNMRLVQTLRTAAPSADPGLILARLNEALFNDDRFDAAFVTAVCVLIDLTTRTCVLARGGAPYPIVRRGGGATELICPAGPLIGVLPSAKFPVQRLTLAPGDDLLLYTDGLDEVTAANAPADTAALACACPAEAAAAVSNRSVSRAAVPQTAAGCASVAVKADCGDPLARHAADRRIEGTSWFAQLRRDGAGPALHQAGLRHDLLRRLGRPMDDLTALAVRFA